MANILLTFNITTRMFQKILINSLIVQKTSPQVQQALARSDNKLTGNKKLKSMQDSIDSLLIQATQEKSEKDKPLAANLHESDMERIENYLFSIAESLRKIDAEYLIT
jgi:hypothetical protein